MIGNEFRRGVLPDGAVIIIGLSANKDGIGLVGRTVFTADQTPPEMRRTFTR